MPKPFENPLIPNVRLRQLYRALEELRALSPRAFRGLEACFAATAIDLHEGDLVSTSTGAGLLHHVRAIAQRKGNGTPTARQLVIASAKPFAASGMERMLCALGSAMALKEADHAAVVVAYVQRGELAVKDWRRLLALTSAAEAPLLLVALPGALPDFRFPLPVIPVDGSDAIALYRVTQESLVRARAGGGAAVLQCVASKSDPIRVLGAQLQSRQAASAAWVAGLAPALKRLRATR